MLESGIKGYQVCSYNPWWTLFPPALRTQCPNHNADIIHTTPDYALFSACRNASLVITFHNYVLDSFMAPYSSVLQQLHYRTDLKWFTRASVRLASVITAVSRYTAELVSNELQLGARLRIIYNGIDETRFTPNHAGKPGKSVRVLFCGNLSSRKGADLLPDIARQLDPGIELLYTTGLRSGHRLPDSPALKCVGSIAHEIMPELYNSVDMLLFPTVREGLSLAVLEAMACGLPIITTDCASMPELVDDASGGYLCPAGDAPAFAARINELANMPMLRKEMSAYNRARIETDFTRTRMIREYLDLFEQVAGTA
jgi:glycosyltransferase involved in cell wall biosynthesis